MIAKYLIPALIITTVLFWLLATFIPIHAQLFTVLQNISFGVFLLYFGIQLGMVFRLIMQYAGIDYPGLIRERIQIPLTDNVILHGRILSTSRMDESTPVVIACHGWIGRMEWLNSLVYALVAQGYKVVGYNHRGHGMKPYKSGGIRSEIQKTLFDIQQVVDFIESRPDLNHEKLAALGFSLGGSTVLTGGYMDPRIRLIIAFCASHDSMDLKPHWSWYLRLFFRLTRFPRNMTEAISHQISPKYYLSKKREDKVVCLVHCKNDRMVPFSAFLKNKELLGLPDEQTLSFARGDHGFVGQETVFTSQVIKWLKNYL